MNMEQKPALYNVIAITTLLSGIVNLFWGFVASATALGTIVGVVCLPVAILPTILGVFEIIYAAKLLSAQPQPAQPAPTLAAFQIATFIYGNVFSAVVGILNLIFFNDLAVKEYFAKLNRAEAPAPQPAVEPIPPAPAPQPAIEPIPPAPEESAPAPEPPVKPRRIRKIARGDS